MNDLKEKARQVVEAYYRYTTIHNAREKIENERDMFKRMADECEVEEVAEVYRDAWAHLGALETQLRLALNNATPQLSTSVYRLDEELKG